MSDTTIQNTALKEQEDRLLEVLVQMVDESWDAADVSSKKELWELTESITTIVGKVTDIATLGATSAIVKGAKAIKKLFDGGEVISSQDVFNALSGELQGLLFKRLKKTEARVSALENQSSVFALVRSQFHEQEAEKEIEEAKTLLFKGHIEIAETLLSRARQQRWSELDDYRKYRVLALLGTIAEFQQNIQKAAELWLDAHKHNPDDTTSLILTVNSYIFLNDFETATEMAKRALEKKPVSSDVWMARARASYSVVDLKHVINNVPAIIGDTVGFKACIADRYLKLGEEDMALEWAKGVTAEAEKEFLAWATISSVLLRKEIRKIEPGAPVKHVAPLDTALLTEIIISATKALNLLDKPVLTRTRATLLTQRATAKKLLDDKEGASADFVEAYETAPDEPHVCAAYAQHLHSIGRRDKGLEVIATFHRIKSSKETRFAELLLNHIPDNESALDECILKGKQYLLNFTDDTTASRIVTLSLMIRGRGEEATQIVTSLPEEQNVWKKVLTAQIALFNSDETTAQQIAQDIAASNITDDAPRELVEITAQILTATEEYQSGLNLWQKLYTGTKYDMPTQSLLLCAQQLGLDNTVLKICQELSENGISEPILFWNEFKILEQYNPDDAIALLLSAMEKAPDDTRLLLALIYMAGREGREDLLREHIDAALSVETVTLNQGLHLTQGLRVLQRKSDAVDYAYALLRRFPSDYQSHINYFEACLFQGGRPQLETACIGAAVEYKENTGRAVANWKIIEASLSDHTFDEDISADTPMGKELIGKKAGDEFVLARGSGGDRKGIILQVLDKYVYKFRDVAEQYQIRFPDESGIEVYEIDPGDGQSQSANFDFLTEIIKKLQKNEDAVIDAYLSTPLPITSLGQFSDIGPVRRLFAFAVDSHTPVRAWKGTDQNINEAVQKLTSGKNLVVDATAIATLLLHNRLHLIKEIDRTVYISRGTLRLLRNTNRSPFGLSRAGFFSFSSVGHSFSTLDPAENERKLSARNEAMAIIENDCELVDDMTGLSELPMEKRQHAEDLLGLEALESAYIAYSRDCLLWTDDYFLGKALQELYPVEAIWTQGVAAVAWTTADTQSDDFIEMSAAMWGMGYENVRISAEIIKKMGQMSQWRTDQFPFPQFSTLDKSMLC